MFDSQSGLTIDWSDIKEFEFGGYQSNYISIKLLDKEKYISFFKNPVTKFMYRLNSKLLHGTFTINVSTLKCNNDNLFETLELYLKAAKNQAIINEKAN
ncbi:MAG: hypothetical protein JNL49_06970 [Bacteroidia bacterium]|nr:hypothetical protein [Bacteroidia bacterium]